jgi:hypothetical protein
LNYADVYSDTYTGSDAALPDKFFPPGIARTAATIATTQRGAVSGIAELDTAVTTLKPAHLAAGEVIWVRWNGAWPAARPTARTDISVWSEAPSTISAPASWAANAPPWLINGDRFEIVDVYMPAPFPDAGVFPDSGALLRS